MMPAGVSRKDVKGFSPYNFSLYSFMSNMEGSGTFKLIQRKKNRKIVYIYNANFKVIWEGK